MISRAAILLLVCATLGFFLDREGQRGTFDQIDRTLAGRLHSGAGRQTELPKVVLVELRDGDLDPPRRTFDSWPPEPLDYALLFENLIRLQPGAVVVEPVLSWPQLSPLDASTLAERITLLPRASLSCVLTRASLVASDDTEWPLPRLGPVMGDIAMVPEFSHILMAPDAELRAGKGLAFSRINPDPPLFSRGTTARVPLLARHGTDVVPSLVLQTLLQWTGTRPEQTKIILGESIQITPSLTVPIDRSGAFVLDLKFIEPLSRLEAGGLLLDASRDENLMRQEAGSFEALQAITNGIVLVGDTTTTARLDLPGGRRLAPAEVMAHALSNIQNGRHFRGVDPSITRGLFLLVGVCGLVQLRLSRRWTLAVGAALVLTLMTAVVVTFRLAQIVIPPTEILTLSAATTMIAILLSQPQAPVKEAPSPAGPVAGPDEPAVGTKATDERTGPKPPASVSRATAVRSAKRRRSET